MHSSCTAGCSLFQLLGCSLQLLSDSTYADLTASVRNLLRRRLAVRKRIKTPMGVKYLQRYLVQCVAHDGQPKSDKVTPQCD